MNKVFFVGRLAADPEIRNTRDGKSVASFRIAVDKYKEGADFFDVSCFDKRAEFADKYLKKGTKIIMTGRAQVDEWTDRDNNKRSKVTFVADEIEFAESRRKDEQEQPKESGFVPVKDLDDSQLPFNF